VEKGQEALVFDLCVHAPAKGGDGAISEEHLLGEGGFCRSGGGVPDGYGISAGGVGGQRVPKVWEQVLSLREAIYH
jgi:hypothetical protein